MSNQGEWVERAARVFTPNYRPAPVMLERGEGVFVYDRAGRRYLDLVAGIAVSALGHNHPRLAEAVARQASRLMHTSNLYLNRPSIELAERLVELSFGDRVFFCNSGAEANEACIKLARRYAHDQGEPSRHRILSFHRSFHGRTFAALAATGQPKYHEGFGPMPPGFVHLPFGDVAALEAELDETVAAVLVEPIQGEGGVNPAPPGFLSRVRQLCDATGALMIVDEVQSGVGRTGRMWGYELEDVRPDVIAVAKGVGGGTPLGALVARDAVARALQPGTHGSTYGGSPLACAAGCAVLDEVRQPPFLENVRAVGEQLQRGLFEIGGRHEVFSEVRGHGLMIGAGLRPEVSFAAADLVEAAREQGVLVHVAGPRTLRLVPPLILGPAEAREGLERLEAAVESLRARGG
jgi:acetylornithine/N-succinyldiaminopimelate aminotransferase